MIILFFRLKALSPHVVDEGSRIPDELLYGRSGYLFSLLFVNKHIFPAPIEKELITEVKPTINKNI